MLNVAVALGTAPRPRPGGARRARGWDALRRQRLVGALCMQRVGGIWGVEEPHNLGGPWSSGLTLEYTGVSWKLFGPFLPVPGWMRHGRALPGGPARRAAPSPVAPTPARPAATARAARQWLGEQGVAGVPAGRSGSLSSEADVAWNAAAAEGTRTRHLPTSFRLKTRPRDFLLLRPVRGDVAGSAPGSLGRESAPQGHHHPQGPARQCRLLRFLFNIHFQGNNLRDVKPV